MYTDKILVCKDCGKEFTFTAGEQEFYTMREFNTEPSRCPDCRKARKASTRQIVLYEIVCSQCGKVDKISFEPRHDRAVFCNECNNKRKF